MSSPSVPALSSSLFVESPAHSGGGLGVASPGSRSSGGVGGDNGSGGGSRRPTPMESASRPVTRASSGSRSSGGLVVSNPPTVWSGAGMLSESSDKYADLMIHIHAPASPTVPSGRSSRWSSSHSNRGRGSGLFPVSSPRASIEDHHGAGWGGGDTTTTTATAAGGMAGASTGGGSGSGHRPRRSCRPLTGVAPPPLPDGAAAAASSDSGGDGAFLSPASSVSSLGSFATTTSTASSTSQGVLSALASSASLASVASTTSGGEDAGERDPGVKRSTKALGLLSLKRRSKKKEGAAAAGGSSPSKLTAGRH
ncbi:hypothetical protein MMPV_002424 [Pyropia vietnamensis]